MDVNGTRFHLLTGPDDWEPRLDVAAARGLWWDREQASLSLLPRVLRFAPRASEALLTPERRRGAGCDAYGNFYWIDTSAQGVRLLPVSGTVAGDYWSVAALQSVCAPEGGAFAPLAAAAASPPTLRGLAVTREHYLVVGTLDPGGLLVFDLHGGGPPSWLRWPVPFAPFDIAPAPDGGLWALERGAAPRLWRLDRHFRVVPPGMAAPASTTSPDFMPLDGAPSSPAPTTFPVGLELATGSPLELDDPVAVEGLPDGSVLVLGASADGGHSVICRFRDGLPENLIALSGGILDQVLEDPRVKAHDFAFRATTAGGHPDEVAGELTLVLEDGNQALSFGLEAFRREFTLTIRPHYLPLRRYSGKALVAGGDAVYYDLDERWYPVTPQPRRRYERKAHLEALVFDGKEPGCVWHRVLLDACIPDGTRIEFLARAADEIEQLADLDWVAQPLPYRRGHGAEIAWHQPFSETERALPGAGTWELLLQHASGRYCELALRLTGDGRATPRLRALRLYYPRFSYVEKFLPAIYREEPHSASFLDRYLANVEGMFATVEARIAAAEALIDIRTAPSEFLKWLAGWLGALLDPDWDEARRRLFIEHAELLFRWRGTPAGMRAAIRLAIEPCAHAGIFDELREPAARAAGAIGGRNVRIVERFLYRELPGVTIGDPTEGGELASVSVTTGLEELGDPERLSTRYRAFLERRYAARASAGQDALAALNARWGTDLTSFDEIVFAPEPPADGARADWIEFVQRELALAQRWKPEHGAYALHVRYQESLRRRYAREQGAGGALAALNAVWGTTLADFDAIRFSPVVPAAAAVAQDWLAFVADDIGFTYAPVRDADLPTWREFLASRYRVIDALNQAWGRSGTAAWSGFAQVPLPAEDAFPSGGRPLLDWIQFVSLMLPIRRSAHRFTVLVPTAPEELPDARALRIGQVEEIVKREKPAHTDYDVKLFWALFQVGSARLGADTVLGDSARYVAIVLGGTYLGRGLLGHGQPWNAADRRVLGRDRLPRSMQVGDRNE